MLAQKKAKRAWQSHVSTSGKANINQAIADNPGLITHVERFIESDVWRDSEEADTSKVERVCRSRSTHKSLPPTFLAEYVQ